DPAGHAAEHLFRDDAVGMRVIPKEAWTLTVTHRDLHLVFELLAGMKMDKDIVAVPPRRDAHAMEMQIAWVVRQIVLECNSHNVARACSEQRRQIGVIVQRSGECALVELNRA